MRLVNTTGPWLSEHLCSTSSSMTLTRSTPCTSSPSRSGLVCMCLCMHSVRQVFGSPWKYFCVIYAPLSSPESPSPNSTRLRQCCCVGLCVMLSLALFREITLRVIFVLQAFNVVFHKAVQNADASSDVKTRVNTLIDCITFSTFNYINRGLFERDKLTFAAQLTFQVMQSG